MRVATRQKRLRPKRLRQPQVPQVEDPLQEAFETARRTLTVGPLQGNTAKPNKFPGRRWSDFKVTTGLELIGNEYTHVVSLRFLVATQN